MGALTRGERRTAGAGLFRAEDNLESPWAHRALTAFYAALDAGRIEEMTREAFEARTGLTLVDSEGALKDPEHLPPMNTFLNRLLALRICDQNLLFVAFEAILSAMLERAQASGALDRGVEDIVADAVELVGDEVVRIDPGSGAETRLLTFEARTRRQLRTADAAAAEAHGAEASFVINARSGRAAVALQGLTLIDEHDRLSPAVRLVRPETRNLAPLAAFRESAWEACSEARWRAVWDAELAGLEPWVQRRVVLVAGLLLPVWSHLPQKQAQIRRLKAPDGRRWLGRRLETEAIAALKAALGVSDLAAELRDGAEVERLVLQEGAEIALRGGLWLRRVQAMGRSRLEVVGAAAERQTFVQLGCFVEIVAYTPRVFVPVGRPAVLEQVLAHWPPQRLLPAAA